MRLCLSLPSSLFLVVRCSRSHSRRYRRLLSLSWSTSADLWAGGTLSSSFSPRKLCSASANKFQRQILVKMYISGVSGKNARVKIFIARAPPARPFILAPDRTLARNLCEFCQSPPAPTGDGFNSLSMAAFWGGGLVEDYKVAGCWTE